MEDDGEGEGEDEDEELLCESTMLRILWRTAAITGNSLAAFSASVTYESMEVSESDLFMFKSKEDNRLTLRSCINGVPLPVGTQSPKLNVA